MEGRAGGALQLSNSACSHAKSCFKKIQRAVQVDGLIVNCSAFNPTPSLSAAVINHFKFKGGIRSFNLSGMGCAASVIAVDMARELLKARACIPVLPQKGNMQSARWAANSHPQRCAWEQVLCSCHLHACSSWPLLHACTLDEGQVLAMALITQLTGGMGSLSGCVCLVQSNPRMRIIVAGTENILWNIYRGNQRSMMITNCIFRLGGVAFLLSNHPADRRRAKYRLTHLVRTHLGASDEAYKCARSPCSPILQPQLWNMPC
jgi:hypothetical protein